VLGKPFGSGYFGEWIEDEFGLPAYRYTCDQINDFKAITPMNEVWHSKTDHWHQVGNDRLVALASNYGYIQVRQDEGSPKFLNEFDPNHEQYAGGFGYLTDGKNFISTFYPGNADCFERIFGIGYFRKKVSGKNLIADQIIFAPFGDDPILISQLAVSNNRDKPVNLRWIEYWGCQLYQFSPDAYLNAMNQKNVSLTRKLRREFSKQFTHEFKLLNGNEGLIEIRFFKTRKDQKISASPKAVITDMNPPKTFLISMDGKIDGFSTNGLSFFGEGGLEAPDGLNKSLDSNITTSDDKSAMLLERKIRLNAHESKTIYFAFGYIPENFELESLLNKYKSSLNDVLANSSKQWKKNNMKLEIPDEPWILREILWHNYYLRGSMTYDNYFKEHILSQGSVYQYIIGFQGALRDPMQHVLPFIYNQPEIVKEIIRYILKTTKSNGEIPYGIMGSGMMLLVPYKPSDQNLWLLWLVSEYVLVTRDIHFLDEEVPIYPVYGRNIVRSSVKDLLLTSYKYFTEILGVGQHGLQRISNGDWNDGIILGHISKRVHDEIIKDGESVLNAAMASYILKKYGEMLKFMGDTKNSEKALQYANNQKQAVKNQWNSKWFNRAWLTKDIGWIGKDQLWLEPQPWAIIGNAADSSQIKILIKSIDELLRQPSKIGAKLLSKGIKKMKRELGMRVNGGIWASINGSLIWALSLVDGDMAWDEWKKNSLAFHAENYPEIWYGIWSGPDVYNSDLSKFPGQTHFSKELISIDKEEGSPIYEDPFEINWTDFPILNLHSHAWPLFNLTHLIGTKFTLEGVALTPILPKEEYKFSSPILGFKKSKEGYSGWYHPLSEGQWKISLTLKKEELSSITSLLVNNKEEEIAISKNTIYFYGRNTLHEPLKWKLIK
jgi:cellobiose phosphorylase